MTRILKLMSVLYGQHFGIESESLLFPLSEGDASDGLGCQMSGHSRVGLSC